MCSGVFCGVQGMVLCFVSCTYGTQRWLAMMRTRKTRKREKERKNRGVLVSFLPSIHPSILSSVAWWRQRECDVTMSHLFLFSTRDSGVRVVGGGSEWFIGRSQKKEKVIN
jgi:hypothetical protein